LVPNAGFDRTIWQYQGAPADASNTLWESTDATECDTSGSAFVGPGSIVSDCFPVSPGASYFFGFMFKGVSDPTNQGCEVGFFDQAACPTIVGGGHPAPFTAGAGWQQTPPSNVVVPANVNHAVIICANGDTSGTASIEIDRVYFNAAVPAF
jgi:hypothetical protein